MSSWHWFWGMAAYMSCMCSPKENRIPLWGKGGDAHHSLFQQNPRNLILNSKKLGEKNRSQVHMQLLRSISLQAESYFWPSQGPWAATKSGQAPWLFKHSWSLVAFSHLLLVILGHARARSAQLCAAAFLSATCGYFLNQVSLHRLPQKQGPSCPSSLCLTQAIPFRM